ncbi:collagen alpha-1(I) chain-like, partial [Homarus americanus]|uniref:collagen alpha-1(I) chain-like n=1 Tax=Homarus americanus TaxID=6706 RepID=UPI001C4678C5
MPPGTLLRVQRCPQGIFQKQWGPKGRCVALRGSPGAAGAPRGLAMGGGAPRSPAMGGGAPRGFTRCGGTHRVSPWGTGAPRTPLRCGALRARQGGTSPQPAKGCVALRGSPGLSSAPEGPCHGVWRTQGLLRGSGGAHRSPGAPVPPGHLSQVWWRLRAPAKGTSPAGPAKGQRRHPRPTKVRRPRASGVAGALRPCYRRRTQGPQAWVVVHPGPPGAVAPTGSLLAQVPQTPQFPRDLSREALGACWVRECHSPGPAINTVTPRPAKEPSGVVALACQLEERHPPGARQGDRRNQGPPVVNVAPRGSFSLGKGYTPGLSSECVALGAILWVSVPLMGPSLQVKVSTSGPITGETSPLEPVISNVAPRGSLSIEVMPHGLSSGSAVPQEIFQKPVGSPGAVGAPEGLAMGWRRTHGPAGGGGAPRGFTRCVALRGSPRAVGAPRGLAMGGGAPRSPAMGGGAPRGFTRCRGAQRVSPRGTGAPRTPLRCVALRGSPGAVGAPRGLAMGGGAPRSPAMGGGAPRGFT